MIEFNTREKLVIIDYPLVTIDITNVISHDINNNVIEFILYTSTV